jgi:hypothetical protein
MRAGVDREKLLAFIAAVGKAARGPGRIYLVGGSTALLLGLRNQTIDIDIKLDPEPEGIFEAIAALKELLSVNVELASPDDFIPALPGWQERSEFITSSGAVEFYHYDFYGQALAKILRGHRTDLADASALVKLGKVEPSNLKAHFTRIKPEIIRYPAIDVGDFESRVEAFIRECTEDS